jgi:hypothetical protein
MIDGYAPVLQGPDWMVTWFCLWPTVLVPTVTFLLFAVPWIKEHSPALAYISYAVIGAFWCSLFMASCTNPGILMKYNEPKVAELTANHKAQRRFGLRMCQKCRLRQPVQTTHCNSCGVCVYGYDHHCGFMGQCVGGKTVLPFQMFLGGICGTVVFMIVAMLITSSLASK